MNDLVDLFAVVGEIWAAIFVILVAFVAPVLASGYVIYWLFN